MKLRAVLAALLLSSAPVSAEPIKLTGHSQEIFALAFAPAGDRLASASNDGTIRVWTLADGKAVVIKTGGASRTVAFSPDGKLVAGRFENKAGLWNAATGERVAALAGPDPAKDSTVRRVTFSPDGKLLAVGHDLGLVRLWDVATHKPVADLVRPDKTGMLSSTVTALAFTPNGKLLAVGSESGLVVWNVETHAIEKTPSESAKTVSVAFTSDGKRLLVNERARVGCFRAWAVADWTATVIDQDAAPDRFLHRVTPIDADRAIGKNARDGWEMFDLRTCTRTKTALELPTPCLSDVLAVSPDGKALAYCAAPNDPVIRVVPLSPAK